ncbi:MAG: bifunctional chorismate mutase/prephenate dehydratase [Lachnospiraceae bacterium]|nr:bifunctional chorismate mutase/prephenate dehydratase [Lachnospiraceae bacterium]
MKIAYSGIEGSFAQIAAWRIAPDSESVPYRTFAQAYRAVEEGACDMAVLPIENSYAGEVGTVSDLLFHGSLLVSGVYELPVSHCLLGVPGSTRDTVKTVISHPQALEQCDSYLSANGLARLPHENTARAAKEVASRGDVTVGAIASAETAELYGLIVLERYINDQVDNTTRFALLERGERTMHTEEEEPVCSILLFTVRDGAGTLARALSVLADFGYNMRVIRSRPLKNKSWAYYFYTEVDGNLFSEKGERMLSGLSYECGEMKVAGTFIPGKSLKTERES